MPPTAAFTPTELEAYRCALARRLDVLRAELAGDRDKLRIDPNDTDEVSDRKDEADRTIAAGVADAELERDLAEAAEVQAALERIVAGTFGRCLECDEPISRERLQVQPAALRCTACQSAAERRSGSTFRAA